jgi:NitT/TauT family transport system substrate-binding protein
MRVTGICASGILGVVLSLSSPGGAMAEVNEVRLARQYGIAYVPLILMQEQKLVEKHARAAGLGEVKVTWLQFAGGNVMNDALLSGNLDFAVAGVPPFMILWSRTQGAPASVKALASLNAMPMYLITRNPDVKSIKDFTEKDKIVVSAVKVSTQALALQMAAAKEWGFENHDRLDKLTVAMGLADSMAILMSGKGEITADFTVPPFSYRELKQPGMRVVLDTYQAAGGPTSSNLVYSTNKFRETNPKLTQAVLAALKEAQDSIKKNTRMSAEAYLRVTGDKDSVDDVSQMIADPKVEYSTTPQGVMAFANFMHRVGVIKIKPNDWKELFLPDVHSQPGN